jgi:outer membrane immunogenic protein
MKRVLFASVGALTLAAMVGTAGAADLPRREPVFKAPVVAPAFSWTGHYIGGHIGGLWGDKDWFEPISGFSTSHDFSGFLAGGQIGFNYQTGQWVWGIQGDWAWTNADGGSNCSQFGLSIGCDTEVEWLASVTARLGYTWDRSLLYVKGGAAWEKDNYSASVSAPFSLVATADHTRSGWTIGAGWEYAFQRNWTAFVEYNYYDFGDKTVDFTTSSGAFSIPVRVDETKHVVKVGINYLFNFYGGR